MGRNTHPYRGPRTALVADRETERAYRISGSPSFGVRRKILEPWADRILGVTLGLQADGKLPDESKLQISDKLGVTLLGQRVLARRWQRGVIGMEQVNKVRSNLASIPTRRHYIPLTLGKIGVLENRVIYATVEGEEIVAEDDQVYAGLAVAGLKGVERPGLHVTLATARNGKAISREYQEAAIDLLQRQLPSEFEAAAWSTYPDTDVFAD